MKSDLDEAKKGTCEQCGKKKVYVRRIESDGSEFGADGRGFFNVCFDCVKPVRIWFKGKLKMQAPLNWTKEEIEKYLNEGRRPVAWKTFGEPKHFDNDKEEYHR